MGSERVWLLGTVAQLMPCTSGWPREEVNTEIQLSLLP